MQAGMSHDVELRNTTSDESGRLRFLDSMRGLAALYVVLSHVLGPLSNQLPPSFAFLITWTKFSHSAVGVFIVISGYVLMIPVARSGKYQLPGSFFQYIKRRARRLLPPYYAALVLSLIVLGLGHRGTGWHALYVIATTGKLLPYAFLYNNLQSDLFSYCGVFWSVATEWQIYFLFPLILLTVWRRFGPGAMLLLAFAVGFTPATHSNHFGAYLGLFALGCVAASIQYGTNGLSKWRDKMPWNTFACLMIVVEAGVCFTNNMNWIITDPLIGITTACCVIALTQQSQRILPTPKSYILSILESRVLVLFGTMSYSLYLCHLAAAAPLAKLAAAFHCVGPSMVAFHFFVGIPWIIVFAIVFHVIFERPFLPVHYQQIQNDILPRKRSRRPTETD